MSRRGGRGGQGATQRSSNPSGGSTVAGAISRLVANHYEITVGKIRTLYQYKLDFRELRKDGKPILDPGPAKDDEGGSSVTRGSTKRRGIPPLMRRRLIQLALWDHPSLFATAKPLATDYKTKMITGSILSCKEGNSPTVTKGDGAFYLQVSYRDELQQCSPTANLGGNNYSIKIKGPTALSLSDLLQSLSTQQPKPTNRGNREAMLDALNIVFSYRPLQRCLRPLPAPAAPQSIPLPELAATNGSKSFFGVPQDAELQSPTGTGRTLTQNPSGGLDSIPGFLRSVRGIASMQGRLTLNVHSVTSQFYHPGSLQHLIEKWQQKHLVAGNWTRSARDDLAAFLKNLSVRTAYQPVDRFERVSDIPHPFKTQQPLVWNCSMIDGGQSLTTTVAEHFRSITNRLFPAGQQLYVVTVGDRDTARTIPATCLNVMPGQVYRSQKELPDGATRSPEDNRDRICGLGRDLFFGSAPDTRGAVDFDLGLAKDLLRVPFIRLTLPQVQYRLTGNSTGFRQQRYDDGTWNLQNSAFVRAAGSRSSTERYNWTFVELKRQGLPSCHVNEINQFRDKLPVALRSVGMENFRFVPLQDRHSLDLAHDPNLSREARLKAQSDGIDKWFTAMPADIQLVMVILPKHDTEVYGAVKRAGDQKRGVHTVCSILRTKFRHHELSMDFLANLSMKINLKVSRVSVNQTLASKGPILTDRTMIVGIDVTHPGPTALFGAPSIAAVVGSVDSHFSQWPASLGKNPIEEKGEKMILKTMGVQPKGGADKPADEDPQANEQILKLDELVYTRLADYYTRNGHVPDQLIVYRDGLSEGQFSTCEGKEFPRIEQAVRRLEALDRQRRSLALTPGQGHGKGQGKGKGKGTAREQEQEQVERRRTKIVLICAVKRNHTRFFPPPGVHDDKVLLGQNRRGQGAYNYNPRPGTLVEQDVTYGRGRDFFLISQKAIIGTARPTHYVVLKNEPAHTLRDVATMTNNLCFLYGRATRSTGVCPPVYYADLAADRARCYARAAYHPPTSGERRAFRLPRDDFSLDLHPDLAGSMFYI